MALNSDPWAAMSYIAIRSTFTLGRGNIVHLRKARFSVDFAFRSYHQNVFINGGMTIPGADVAFQIGPYCFRPSDGSVRRDGLFIHLTRTEARLLSVLCMHPNERLSADQLFSMVWNESGGRGYRARVDTQLASLRQKLQPDLIRNIRGYGYQLAFKTLPAPDDSAPLLLSEEQDTVAITAFGGAVRLITISSDGRYRFLDEHDNLHRILYAYSRETRALQNAVEEFESLVNSRSTKEIDLQRFFERNPAFIKNDEYKAAHPRVVLARDGLGPLIPDFMLEPLHPKRMCDILDIKLPSAKVFVMQQRRFRFSADILEACAQVREYSCYFDDVKHQQLIRERYGLSAYRPRLFIVIGRLGNVEPHELRRAELDLSQVHVRTYDDLLLKMRTRVAQLQQGHFHP
jgi:DNA-binding winged helix-turn-helix (wHTH) protein